MALNVPPIIRNDPYLLQGLGRGIEKESLRVSTEGVLSGQPHPYALGSALTHPSITTDFSEAQLELITGVHTGPEDCLTELETIHRFVYANIGDELLWPASMPCVVGSDQNIPIGQYGNSNIGIAKSVYRRGLGVRYGRLMQTISGIHYNFSIPDDLWSALGVSDQIARTDAYFGLIRNFRRWSWLLIYAFGASPAVCKSFTQSGEHALQQLDEGTHYLPGATSLRMGPLGYQSSAQTSLHISYNSLQAYADSMVQALTTPYPDYEASGLKDAHGDHQQLSTSILQIENEFYGTIRPKRTIQIGERPVTALRTRGVEYVEVRCIDLNPFLPLGIDTEEIRFIDTFLLTCLFSESAPDTVDESHRIAQNQLAVVERGREDGLRLHADASGDISLTDWADAILTDCAVVATLLDQANGAEAYSAAVVRQREKVTDPELTPSALSLAVMRETKAPFFRFAMDQAMNISQAFKDTPLPSATAARMLAEIEHSHQRQRDAEAMDTLTFDEFLLDYLALPE